MAQMWQNELYLNCIKQNSRLIRVRLPALYCLNTNRINLAADGMIRKCTFGQRDISKPNKTLLMVGETGTGKTTLINVMVNYALGVNFDDNVWFYISEDAQTSDQTTSQTLKTTVYEVSGPASPFSLTMIDTQGFGDTRGPDYDQQIATNLYNLFLNDAGVKEIDAVCLVVRAGMYRLSKRQRYIFDAVLSLFGNNMEHNIVICVTHSDGFPPTNIIRAVLTENIPCRKDSRNQPVYFTFNNRQNEEWVLGSRPSYQAVWDQSVRGLSALFFTIQHHSKISIDQTRNVLVKRIQLKACIFNLKDQIELTEGIQNKLTRIQDIISAKENKTITIMRFHKEKVKKSGLFNKVTTCSICEENCHSPCKFTWSASSCEVMKNGRCTVCTRKCPDYYHVRQTKNYILRNETETTTYEKLKEELDRKEYSETKLSYDQDAFAKVEASMRNREKKIGVMEKLKEEKTNCERKMTELLNEACMIILTLCFTALKPDCAFIMEHLDFLIERKKQAGDTQWVQQLEELRKIEPEDMNQTQIVRNFIKAKFPGFF